MVLTKSGAASKVPGKYCFLLLFDSIFQTCGWIIRLASG